MMFHYLNYKTMATNNISELIKSATDYVDYTSGYAHLFADNKGGDKCIYSVCKIGKHTYMGKITENIRDTEKGIGDVWSDAGILKEQENWEKLENSCMLIVTDSAGNILQETPRRYY